MQAMAYESLGTDALFGIRGLVTADMDEFSGVRVLKKFASSSKGYSLMRDTASSRARKAEICSRLDLRNRQNLTRGTQLICLDKCKYSSSAHLDVGKDNIGSSSGTSPSAMRKTESLVIPKKTLASHLVTDSSDTSSVLDEPELAESVPPPGKIRRGPNAECTGDEVGEVNPDAERTSSVAQSSRTRMSCSNSAPLSSRHAATGSIEARNLIEAKRANESGDVLTNSRINSVTNSRSINESSPNSSLNRRKSFLNKTITCGEASTSNGVKNGGKQSFDGRTAHNFEKGVAISESRTRRARYMAADRDAAMSSVRARRQNGYSEPRNSTQSNSSMSTSVSPVMSLRMHHSEILNEMSSSLRRPTETSSGQLAARIHPGSSSDRSRCAFPSDIAEMSTFTRSLLNDDGFPQYHMEGIAEVLLALERIGQDDELSYEQAITLENNLFLNGMSFYDQHRDMRLDIDNMSYEELLALEERMGTVSTALTEEELSKCMKREVFHPKPSPGSASCIGGLNDDLKCSICQEEYVSGDRVGRLPCQHRYHVACVQQWLGLKNWCPICKGSATSSSSSRPSLC